MSNVANKRGQKTHGSYPLLGRFLDPTPAPQHIADALAAGVPLDADWLAEIEQIRTQEATGEHQR